MPDPKNIVRRPIATTTQNGTVKLEQAPRKGPRAQMPYTRRDLRRGR